MQPHAKPPLFPLALAGVILSVVCHPVGAQTAEQVLTPTRIQSGLAVVVGTADGALESGLANGHMLVQGISTDAAKLGAARARIAKAGRFPFANVAFVEDYKSLPWGDHLVNLLVADLDALGPQAPALEEVRRVVAYGGKAYVKQGGWKVIDIPYPANVDEWPYQHHNPMRTSVSRDELAGSWSALKWIAGPRTQGAQLGMRIQGGQVYLIRSTDPREQTQRHGGRLGNALWKKPKGQYLIARDAFNGTLLWTRPVGLYWEGGMPNRGMTRTGCVGFVAHNGKVFAYPEKGGYLTAYDGRTGAVVREYDKTAKPTPSLAPAAYRLQEPEIAYAISHSTVFFHGGRMFQSHKNRLWALNEETGAVLWTYEQPDANNWVYQAVPGDDGHIYAAITANGPHGTFKDNVKGHLAAIKAIVKIDATNGREIWRNEATFALEKSLLGQFFGGAAHGVFPALIHIPRGFTLPDGFKVPFDGIAAMGFSMADGRLMWKTGTNLNWTSADISVIDGKVWAVDYNKSFVFEPLTGNKLAEAVYPLAAGCMAITMTEKYMYRGPIVHARPEGLPTGRLGALETPASWRSGCGEKTYPAYGQLYSPGTGCGCTWYVPGDLAVYKTDPVRPIPDVRRRIAKTGDLAGATVVGAVKAPGNDSALYDDWMLSVDFNLGSKGTRWDLSKGYTWKDQPGMWNLNQTTEPVTASGLQIQSVIHENRIEATRNGAVAWTFLAGGRVSVAPVTVGGLVIFGSHDGWVYALKSADGSVAWRYFAAPVARNIVAYGQVESAWPLYGVGVADGKIVYMAGRNSGIDDGMFAGALDPATGASAWRVRIARYDHAKFGHFMNAALKVEGDSLFFLGNKIDLKNPKDLVVPYGGSGPVGAMGKGAEGSVAAPAPAWDGAERYRLTDLHGRRIRSTFEDSLRSAGLDTALSAGMYMIEESGQDGQPPAVLRVSALARPGAGSP